MPIEVRAEFLSKKGDAFRRLGVNTFNVDPEKSIAYQVKALSALLDAVDLYFEGSKPEQFAKTIEILRETFRFVFICASRALTVERPDLVSLILRFFGDEVRAKRHHFDVAEQPLLDCLRILQNPRSEGDVTRNRSFVHRLMASVGNAGMRFRDESSRQRILAAGRIAVSKLA